jgi:DNA-binding GntR family transcriptional regulator
MNRIADQMKPASLLATEEIRRMIQRGALEPGQRISIDYLADMFGISRTPVREAVQRLELEGLVEVIPRIGVLVRSITLDEARDVYLLKAAIEPLAARWAAERAPVIAAGVLGSILENMEEAVKDEDVIRYADLVEQFHQALIEAAGSPALVGMWSVISGRVHQLRMLNLMQQGRLEASLQQHRAVRAAVASSDGDAAGAAMTDHMNDAHASALRAVAQVSTKAD